jgi:hypothetical protein
MTYQVDLTQPLLDIDGDPIIGGPTAAPMSLRDGIRQCCENDPRAELDGDKKLKCYHLAKLVKSSDTVTMTDADFILIRERSGSLWGPVLHGQICEMLDYYLARKDAAAAEEAAAAAAEAESVAAEAEPPPA